MGKTKAKPNGKLFGQYDIPVLLVIGESNTGQLPITKYASVKPVTSITVHRSYEEVMIALFRALGEKAIEYLKLDEDALTEDVLKEVGEPYGVETTVKATVSWKALAELV